MDPEHRHGIEENQKVIRADRLEVGIAMNRISSMQTRIKTSTDGETMIEICRALGISKATASKTLYMLREQGLLGVGRKKIVDLMGRHTSVPVYWRKDKGEK